MTDIDEVRVRTVSTDRDASPVGLSSRLRRHLADPFSRNSYALILNTVLTGLLGVLYWMVAARHYTDADVGRGAALISTMMLLSGVVAINVTGTLSRFIPQAGRGTGRLLLHAYGLSAVAVAVLSAGFLLTLDHWGPSFDLLRNPSTAVWFILAVVASAIFTIQDGALVGLRKSVWVPVENAVFGIAKIVLLVLLANSFPHDGLYLSWVIPMAILVLPVNGLIFGRLVPRRHRATPDGFLPPSRTQVRSFFAGDYVGALFVFASVYLVPVIVASSVAPRTFAYFYVVWSVSGILHLVAVNLAASLTVEGVYEAHRLAVNCRAALRRALGILLLAAVIVALAAPYVLSVLGRGYVDAALLLQLLALAALPRAMVEIWIGVLRAQGQPRQIARVQIASGGLLVGFVLLWLQVDQQVLAGLGVQRITGVGLAVLASQAVVAIAVLPRLRRFIRQPVDVMKGTPAANRSHATDQSQEQSGAAGRKSVEPARWSTSSWLPVAGVCVVGVAGLVCYLLSLGEVVLDRMNGYGLISVLPVAALVGLALLTLAFVMALFLRRSYPVVLGAHLVVMVGCLHGVTALIEPLPRFSIAWVHLGFVEYIARTGTTAPGLDGRFSWPGFFALVAMWVGRTNWTDLVAALALTPLISNLLFLLPLGLLLRNLRASWQAKWFAAWLFAVLNWVGQDYFSPQGFSYWLYLIFLAVLVTWFRPAATSATAAPEPVRNHSPGRRWWPTPVVPGELPPRPAEYSVQVALLFLAVGLFTVATVSHQLTPFLMVAACAGLVLARRCVITGLPMLLTVILVGWISFMTVAYWSGHLGSLLEGIGNVLGNVANSVWDRASSGSTQHHAVLFVRAALTVGLFALAVFGMLRRRWRAVDDRIAVVLVATPFVAVALHNYGGEIAMRVYLFALPAAALLAAYAFFPETGSGPRSPRRFIAVGACALVLVGGFFPARYGNEQYEITRVGELAAVNYVYQQGRPARILLLTDTTTSDAPPFVPIGYQDVETVSHLSTLAPRDPDDVSRVVSTLRELGRDSYLMTTRSQEAYLEVKAGYPPGWGDRFRTRLAATPDVQVVAQTPDAVVYTHSASQSIEPAPQPATGTATQIGKTPWTPAGVVFLTLLLVVLTWRELWRLRLAPDARRRLRTLTLAAVPLLIGLALVVAERLVLLSP
ncbi:MAG: lipopolysaccharide biosynthesis protein [Pseudonocardiaceae bacterium]